MRKSSPHGSRSLFTLPFAGLLVLLLAAYFPLILHPGLHTACPENDTWNLPLRWSVLSSLRSGFLPLWNPLSAFGIPWLASWQTETFYPGTLLFEWLGLGAWNLSGLLHLLLFSSGLFFFLKNSKVDPFWAFFCSALSLVDGCAYNHLGSGSSMDTLAWMPWIFLATSEVLAGKPRARIELALFITLQILAGYPQIFFYTLTGASLYAVFLGGLRSPAKLLPSLAGGLLLSTCQWIPSLEYFSLHAARLPAVAENPDLTLPLDNLRTFLNFNALGRGNTPDYVASPSFFYFNFYAGLAPLGILGMGLFRWKSLGKKTRFFLVFTAFSALWVFGFFSGLLRAFTLPLPAFLEPAKAWVLVVLLELTSLGLILEDLCPRPGKWKWALLVLALADPILSLWNRPLELNRVPPDPLLQSEAGKIKSNLGTGRVLILPDAGEHARLYTPLPTQDHQALFKRFIPNSNLFASLPAANFYGSTWPGWGAMDAQLYFQYAFPYREGTLLDLLGVDLLLLSAKDMPPRFEKIRTDGDWTLWRNPGSLGGAFFFQGGSQKGSLKETFQDFSSGAARPLQTLYLDPKPASCPPRHPPSPYLSRQNLFPLPTNKEGFLVVTQNAMPGWRVWVDGKPRELFTADGFFQCVPVKEGSRQAAFAYEPASFRVGLFLSLLAWAGLGLWGGFALFKGLGEGHGKEEGREIA